MSDEFICSACGQSVDEVFEQFDGRCFSCLDDGTQDVCTNCGDVLEDGEGSCGPGNADESWFCDSCRIDQDNLDNGICPTCMSPIDDSGECVFCI